MAIPSPKIGLALDFIAQLKENNNKPWFDDHRKNYDAARDQVILLAKELMPTVNQLEPLTVGMEPKKALFRINRDVRFSKDKSPYKTNFGIGFTSKLVTSGSFPEFYIHISPDESFVACGCWMPMPKQLEAIRQEIDYNAEEWKGIIAAIETNGFKLDKEYSLKTAPKGYEKENPMLEYLKLKSFTISKPISNEEMSSSKLVTGLIRDLNHQSAFYNFLKRAVAE